MSDYRHMFFSSILHIPRKQWDTIWPFPSEGYDFYLSQETANIADFEFSYLVIYNNDAVALIAPIFITDFNFHLAMEGIVQRAVKSIQRAWPNFLVVKTLFCGSFVSDKGVIVIHPDLQKDDALFGVFEDQDV